MEDNKEDYLDVFDKIFKTNIKENIKDLSIIEKLFDYIESDLYIPNEEYRTKILKIINELEENFTDRQRELTDKIFFLEDKNNRKHEKEFFVFGFILGNELRREILETI